jgi:threonine/homoserine/homoserine lactone efflux protein
VSIEFLLTSLIIVASPGTGAIYTIAAGLSRGGKASVLAAFACTLGIVPHLIAAMMGLAALLHTSALAFEIVKYAGVAYLLFMAWQSCASMARSRSRPRPIRARAGACLSTASRSMCSTRSCRSSSSPSCRSSSRRTRRARSAHAGTVWCVHG